MVSFLFDEEDIKQIKDHGLTLGQVEEQIDFLTGPPNNIALDRPCLAGDGIFCPDQDSIDEFINVYETEGSEIERMKFVPASGVASRMFKTLLSEQSAGRGMRRDEVLKAVREKKRDSGEVLRFMDGLGDFAFFKDLAALLSSRGIDVAALIEKGRYDEIVEGLLSVNGLNYARLPKGLLAFHAYPEGPRSAFEEHLVEAARYLKNLSGECRLAMTVSAEHLERFERLFERVRTRYEKSSGVRFIMDFSVQSPSTDTIAVILEDKPFRDNDGRLVFRPGGHGALIKNLDELDCDMVFITNIDNVVPDRMKSVIVRWKKILGGCLLSRRKEVFRYIEALGESNSPESIMREAESFAARCLSMELPGPDQALSLRERRLRLLELLNRPIRVCGMVKNQGEPGGGPFWVKDKKGTVSLQIVEKAQIDLGSQEQKALFEASTHFNPVDIVCSLRDHKGVKFDLKRFVDPEAVFISRKSHQGRDLKALELPGLWNGAMARWITIFVEVPAETFNPVKTVNDLLRPAHRNDLGG